MSPRSALLGNLGALALVATLLLATLLPTGGAETVEDGYWEFLGEDGAIWVPATPPAVTNLPSYDLGAYHNYPETVALLVEMASARPDLFTLTTIGTSVEGRNIWMMRVTAPGDATGRAGVLLDSAHHGNEVITAEILTRFLKEVHEGYDTDPAMQQMLEAVFVDVVPIVNVDSFERIPSCSHYAMCRKNSNGVDLNRNYPNNWGGSGSSSSPGADTYRGPSPLSEPESQAIAALLDANDYALHASLHSGIELILWPYGWTTARPPDHAVFEALGAELTALTGVPHGQVSRALYLASGTTVDQAYASAAGWRPISFTPEVHGGPGNAFNWWLYFNPPETEAAVSAKVQQWLPFVWHFVKEAPRFAPPTIDAADLTSFGPGAVSLPFSLQAPERRPFVDASMAFVAGDAPIYVDSANPFALPGTGGSGFFELIAYGPGDHLAELVLDAGVAGTVRRPLGLDLQQVALDVTLERPVMGTRERNTATATVAAGPFASVSGEIAFQVFPSGHKVHGIPFSATPGAPATVSASFTAAGLSDGVNRIIATATFTAVLDGSPRPGIARLDTPFTVVRPQLEFTSTAPAQNAVLQPFVVRSTFENTGSLPALNVKVTEIVPPGYTYYPHGSTLSPLGDPRPDLVEPQPDGSIHVTWRFAEIAPGASTRLQYTLAALAPGDSLLKAQWSYLGEYDTAMDLFTGEAARPHRAT